MEVFSSSITTEASLPVLYTFLHPLETCNLLVHLLFCYGLKFWKMRTMIDSLIVQSGNYPTGLCKY